VATESYVRINKSGGQRRRHVTYSREEADAIGLIVIEDWRDGMPGQWVQTEDGYVVEILKSGLLRKGTKWVRTVHGTFLTTTGHMTTEKRQDRFTFTGRKAHKEFKMSTRIKAWASMVVLGHDPVQTYLSVFSTESKSWAEQRVVFLLKNPEVMEFMRSELKPILAELGITQKSVIKGYLDIFTEGDSDNVRLKALNELAIMVGVKEEGQPSLPTGFLGFGSVIEDMEKQPAQVTGTPTPLPAGDDDGAPSLAEVEDHYEP
jgi:hypothetical protein